MTPDEYELDGFNLSTLDAPRLVDYLISSVGKQSLSVCTPNLDFLAKVRRRAELRSIIDQCSVRVVDGWPLQLLARIADGTRLPRIAGSDLIYLACAEAAQRGVGVVLTGGPVGHAELAAAALKSRFPALTVQGVDLPVLTDPKTEGLGALGETLEQSQPGLLFSALGFPKQEILNLRIADQYSGWVCIGVGAGVSFAAHEIKRAPVLVRRLYLEWLFRLLREPKRMFRRYVIDDIPAFIALASRLVASRVCGDRPASSGLRVGR